MTMVATFMIIVRHHSTDDNGSNIHDNSAATTQLMTMVATFMIIVRHHSTDDNGSNIHVNSALPLN